MKSSTDSASPPPVMRIIEALLFVGGAPLTAARAKEIIRNLPEDQFLAAIDSLNRDYRRQARPYVIQMTEEGFVLRLKPQFRVVRERLLGSPREARLTPQSLDVLALIAYRQPINKAELDSQRGTDSRGSLQQLVRLGLVAIESQPDTKPKDAHYKTTARFLELFGLRSLDDLPQTGDLQRL
ncbi:MAG TPA: SMC-Scp complex subunit ScpB [Gemmataceae bacterium]|nr:SMC-Scp complex subunit ScpB [Gemmataceae bacterium]